MNFDVPEIFYYSCLLIAAATGLFCIKNVDSGFKWLAILMLVTLASEAIAKFILYGLSKTNNMVYHFFTPVEYTIYVIIFLQFLGNKKWQRRLWPSAIGLILFEIVNTILFQGLQETSTNVMMMESLFLVFLSLTLFIKIRETPSPDNLLREGVFWFNSAVLCYYSFNTLFWGFHNMEVYTLENPPKFIYDLNQILSGFLYITFATAILLHVVSRASIPKKL